MAPAGAATPGVGTAATTTQVLTAAVGTNGSLLNLNLLGDAGRATTDATVAAPSAFSQLTAAQISSDRARPQRQHPGHPAQGFRA